MIATAGAAPNRIVYETPYGMRIYDNSQEFFRQVLTSLPLHPWSVGLNFEAGDVSIAEGKDYLRRWEVAQFDNYVDRCVDLGIDPFTSVKHEHKAGVFIENREKKYSRRNRDIEWRLKMHSLPSDGKAHQIYVRAWGYHNTRQGEELDLDFPDVLREHIEKLFEQGYHLQNAGLYLSDSLGEFIWQECVDLELNKYQREGRNLIQVGFHGRYPWNTPRTDVEKFLNWVQDLARTNLLKAK